MHDKLLDFFSNFSLLFTIIPMFAMLTLNNDGIKIFLIVSSFIEFYLHLILVLRLLHIRESLYATLNLKLFFSLEIFISLSISNLFLDDLLEK